MNNDLEMTKISSIPDELKEFINKYLKLNIRGEIVKCPYYLNTSGLLKPTVFAGKGSPYEIEMKANEFLINQEFKGDKEKAIRKELETLGLGIDCSGLVYQVYNKWLKDILGKGEMKNYLPPEKIINLRKYLSRRLKPESSVSADDFTSEPLSFKIEVKDIRPGDLIRTRGGKHLLLITDVEFKDLIPKKLIFANSTTSYLRNGVRFGEISLSNELNLATSKWRDLNELNGDDEKSNFAYKGYRELIDDNGVWRLKLPFSLEDI